MRRAIIARGNEPRSTPSSVTRPREGRSVPASSAQERRLSRAVRPEDADEAATLALSDAPRSTGAAGSIAESDVSGLQQPASGKPAAAVAGKPEGFLVPAVEQVVDASEHLERPVHDGTRRRRSRPVPGRVEESRRNVPSDGSTSAVRERPPRRNAGTAGDRQQLRRELVTRPPKEHVADRRTAEGRSRH